MMNAQNFRLYYKASDEIFVFHPPEEYGSFSDDHSDLYLDYLSKMVFL